MLFMKIELSAVGTVITGIVVLFTIIASVLRARKYIEEQVKEALSRDEVIQKLSLLVKPDMVFDDKGSIIIDRGASAFIKDRGIYIAIEDSTLGPIPSEIRISFSKHLKTPPLITPLNPDSVFIRTKRGEAHDWVYELSYSMTTTPDDEKDFSRHYRLEIF